MTYAAMLHAIQDREPDYGSFTYEEERQDFAPVDIYGYTPIYDPPRQADVSYKNPESSAKAGIIRAASSLRSILFYHHADSPDGGGRPYSVGPINVGHQVISDGSWTQSPRGLLDTQNPNRVPLARSLPDSWGNGIPERGQQHPYDESEY